MLCFKGNVDGQIRSGFSRLVVLLLILAVTRPGVTALVVPLPSPHFSPSHLRIIDGYPEQRLGTGNNAKNRPLTGLDFDDIRSQAHRYTGEISAVGCNLAPKGPNKGETNRRIFFLYHFCGMRLRRQ